MSICIQAVRRRVKCGVAWFKMMAVSPFTHGRGWDTLHFMVCRLEILFGRVLKHSFRVTDASVPYQFSPPITRQYVTSLVENVSFLLKTNVAIFAVPNWFLLQLLRSPVQEYLTASFTLAKAQVTLGYLFPFDKSSNTRRQMFCVAISSYQVYASYHSFLTSNQG